MSNFAGEGGMRNDFDGNGLGIFLIEASEDLTEISLPNRLIRRVNVVLYLFCLLLRFYIFLIDTTEHLIYYYGECVFNLKLFIYIPLHIFKFIIISSFQLYPLLQCLVRNYFPTTSQPLHNHLCILPFVKFPHSQIHKTCDILSA